MQQLLKVGGRCEVLSKQFKSSLLNKKKNDHIRLPNFNSHSHANEMKKPVDLSFRNHAKYWRSNINILSIILAVWFFVSFGCAILFKDFLDQFSIGGAPLGFWMAQQGSIICFVILLFFYSFLMNKLDEKYGFVEEE